MNFFFAKHFKVLISYFHFNIFATSGSTYMFVYNINFLVCVGHKKGFSEDEERSKNDLDDIKDTKQCLNL